MGVSGSISMTFLQRLTRMCGSIHILLLVFLILSKRHSPTIRRSPVSTPFLSIIVLEPRKRTDHTWIDRYLGKHNEDVEILHVSFNKAMYSDIDPRWRNFSRDGCYQHYNEEAKVYQAAAQKARGNYLYFLNTRYTAQDPIPVENLLQAATEQSTSIVHFRDDPISPQIINNRESILLELFNTPGWSLADKLFKRSFVTTVLSLNEYTRMFNHSDITFFFYLGLRAESYINVRVNVRSRQKSRISSVEAEELFCLMHDSLNQVTLLLNRSTLKLPVGLQQKMSTKCLEHDFMLFKRIYHDKAGWLYDRLLTSHSTASIVEYLAKEFYMNDGVLAEMLLDSESLKLIPHRIRTIGMYYERYAHGGTERVMSLQIPLFLSMGYSVVLLTETIDPEKEYPLDPRVKRVQLPSSYNTGRAQALVDAIQQERIDLMIHHSHLSEKLLFDLLILKSYNVSVIVYRHMVVVITILMDDSRVLNYPRIYLFADLVIVMSHMEEAYLQSMGVRTVYVPNPIQYKNTTNRYSENEGYIIWVGRLANADKNFYAALEIMQLVAKQRPEAKMIILGESSVKAAEKAVLSFIKKNNLENNIEYKGHVHNISVWYKKARIHLLTSHSECYPMVVLESKSFGIPLVTFSLPYVELLRDGKGVISVPQYDIEAASQAIIQLLDDNDLCHKLSLEARQSLQPFLRFNQKNAWSQIFYSLETVNLSSFMRDFVSGKEMKILLETILSQYKPYHSQHF